MKKKAWVAILTGILLLGTVIVVWSAWGHLIVGRRPFRNLDPSEILSATVRLTPPDKTIRITDIEELTGCLKDVVVYNKDNSYTEYAGQGVTFTLMLADGKQAEVMAYHPFLVMDGVGYRTEPEPCGALHAYANRLLQDENAIVILEEPPQLTHLCDHTAFGALLGTYSWQKRISDGTSTAIEADGAHPLDCKDRLLKFDTTETTVTLDFKEKPDAILSVQCWSEDHWGNPDADSEGVVMDGYEMELKPGGYIYEIIAEWSTEESGYGGRAHYSFYVEALGKR